VAAVRWSLRLVALQAAALALLLATVHSGLYGWLVAVPAAAALALLAVGRWRGRRVSARLAQALRFATRRRSMPVPDPAALLAFARPTAGLGEGPVTVEDAEGVVAVLDLDDPAGLLAASGPRLPAPARLVPAAGARPPGARLTVQLLACAVRPAGSGPVSASYRQLTEGAVLARRRVLLAVRLSGVDGGWPGEELRRALPGTVRRLCRRLERDGYACRPLGQDAARAALAELAPPGGTARERWSGLLLGDWSHTCLHTGGTVPETLVPRLLNAPAGLVAIAMVPDGGGADLAVRLADRSPAALVAAAAWVRQQVAAVGLDPHRPDGAQRDGLAATLPSPCRRGAVPTRGRRRAGRTSAPCRPTA
jgi:type VII secretion protein EccE